jgi:hypothetical protein
MMVMVMVMVMVIVLPALSASFLTLFRHPTT